MPGKELPAPGGKGFTFCALIVLALLVVKEKLSSPLFLRLSTSGRAVGGFVCKCSIRRKDREDGKTVSVPNSHREKFQGGVGPTKLEVCA